MRSSPPSKRQAQAGERLPILRADPRAGPATSVRRGRVPALRPLLDRTGKGGMKPMTTRNQATTAAAHLVAAAQRLATQVEADADAHAIEWTLRTIRHELAVISDALHHRERLVLATCAATVDAHHCGRAASHDGPHACTCGHTWDA